MAKSPRKEQCINIKAPREESTVSIELRSDGETRFRAAVHAAAKSGPKHRPAKGRPE